MYKQSNHSKQSVLIARDISFEVKVDFPILQNINCSFSTDKTGLVGNNGVGKTTFLKLLVGELTPANGKVIRKTKIAYLPQDINLYLFQTVTEILDHAESTHKRSVLNDLNIQSIDSTQKLNNLSGGERMKVLLAGLLMNNPQFLILDEPTNNLDLKTREVIYQVIRNWTKGLLVVSHDRTLLNLMDRTIELTPLGIKEYGGNYVIYENQKRIAQDAIYHRLESTKQELSKTKLQIYDITRSRKNRNHDSRIRSYKTGVSKCMRGNMQRHAENTTGKINRMFETKIADTKEQLDDIKSKITAENQIVLDLKATEVPAGKMVVDLNNVSFAYSKSSGNDISKLILNNFDFSIYGPQRVAINGANGSGKTTLVKLIIGELVPTDGEIKRGVERIAYLDQNLSTLDRSQTLLNNFYKYQTDFMESDVRRWFGRFLFKDSDVHKKVSDLSGGEKIKSALAIALAGKTPPQLLILDEPTNNLDIMSITQLESALSNYQGALIVISHDQYFLERIEVEQIVKL